MELFSFVNDELVPAGRASLLIGDLAIQRGYGIFDFFKTLDHRPIYLDDHLDRFFASAAAMRLEVGKTRDQLRAMLEMLIKKNGIADSGIRIELTGGYSPDGYTLARPNLVIQQQPLGTPVTAELQPSIRLITHPHQRQLPGIKTIDYLMAIWLQPVIREKGADEVLYHWNGVVAECPRSNFFIVTAEGVLVTPAREILKGITRMKILEVAGARLRVEERDLRLEELRAAKEAFITSTTKHILPVTQIDGLPVGDGAAGPVARWLNEELWKFCQGRG